MCDLSDPALKQAVMDVKSDSVDIDWATFGYAGKHKLCVDATGTGSLDAASAQFADDKILYALVRMSDGDQESKRVKFVMITWTGTKVGMVTKGRVAAHKISVSDMMGQKHVEIHADELKECSEALIRKKLKVAGGADYDTGANVGGYKSSGNIRAKALAAYTEKEKVGNVSGVVYVKSALPASTPVDLSGRPMVASKSEALKNTKDTEKVDTTKWQGKASPSPVSTSAPAANTSSKPSVSAEKPAIPSNKPTNAVPRRVAKPIKRLSTGPEVEARLKEAEEREQRRIEAENKRQSSLLEAKAAAEVAAAEVASDEPAAEKEEEDVEAAAAAESIEEPAAEEAAKEEEEVAAEEAAKEEAAAEESNEEPATEESNEEPAAEDTKEESAAEEAADEPAVKEEEEAAVEESNEAPAAEEAPKEETAAEVAAVEEEAAAVEATEEPAAEEEAHVAEEEAAAVETAEEPAAEEEAPAAEDAKEEGAAEAEPASEEKAVAADTSAFDENLSYEERARLRKEKRLSAKNAK